MAVFQIPGRAGINWDTQSCSSRNLRVGSSSARQKISLVETRERRNGGMFRGGALRALVCVNCKEDNILIFIQLIIPLKYGH